MNTYQDFYRRSLRLLPLKLFNSFCKNTRFNQNTENIINLTRKANTHCFYKDQMPPTIDSIDATCSIKHTSDLERLINTRRTERSFTHQGIDFSLLKKVLFLSFGVSCKRNGEIFRNYPSAGALYPLEMFVLSFKVKGLDEGIYHYDPFESTLDQIHDHRHSEEIKNEFRFSHDLEGFSFGILLAANLFTTSFKYGNRGYRYIFLDAGHVMQNTLLLGHSYGLSMTPIGSLNENRFNKLLSLDGKSSTVIYACLGG